MYCIVSPYLYVLSAVMYVSSISANEHCPVKRPSLCFLYISKQSNKHPFVFSTSPNSQMNIALFSLHLQTVKSTFLCFFYISKQSNKHSFVFSTSPNNRTTVALFSLGLHLQTVKQTIALFSLHIQTVKQISL